MGGPLIFLILTIMHGIEIENIQLDKDYAADSGIRALLITVKKPAKMKREELLAKMTDLEGMIALEELH